MAKRVTQREVDSAAGSYQAMVRAYGENNMASERAYFRYQDLRRAREAQQQARKRNPNGADEIPYGEWVPADAVRFNDDGSVSVLTDGERHVNPERTKEEAADELRLKQDFLRMLAVDNAGFPESYRITTD